MVAATGIALHQATGSVTPDAVASIGIGLVLGSDAHRPEEVGFAFPEVQALLAGLGFREAYYFVEGSPVAYPLSRAS